MGQLAGSIVRDFNEIAEACGLLYSAAKECTMHRLILIAHHDDEFICAASPILGGAGYRVEAAADGDRAFCKIEQLRPKVVIADLSATAINCFELIRSVRARKILTTIVVACRGDSGDLARHALHAGAYDVVTTPLQPETLLNVVSRAFEHQDLLDELLALRKALDGGNGFHPGVPEGSISLEAVERQLLLRALEKFSGNQTQAAKYLSISRRTLIYRMNKYRLRREALSRLPAGS